jgi:hypothetical protein
MTGLQQIPNRYVASPLSALLYGLTFFTCKRLPNITTYIAGAENKVQEGAIGTSNYKHKLVKSKVF